MRNQRVNMGVEWTSTHRYTRTDLLGDKLRLLTRDELEPGDVVTQRLELQFAGFLTLSDRLFLVDDL